jgi:excinuclease ABC subunit C
MRTVTSELLKVPGIGPARRTALLRAFGSLDAVRNASEEEIANVPGFSLASARRLIGALRDPLASNTRTQVSDQ